MKILEFTNKPDYYEAFCKALEESMQSLDSNIALAGGSLFELYAQYYKENEDLLKKGNQKFWMLDERFVKPVDANSNLGKLRRSFSGISAERLKGFDTSNVDWNKFEINKAQVIEKVLAAYERELITHDIKFDIVILGIGSDGHIASLFPYSKTLDEMDRKAAHTQTKQFDVKERMTVTYPMLLTAGKIMIFLQGKAKQGVVDKIRNNKLNYHEFPANRLHEHRNINLYYGDWS